MAGNIPEEIGHLTQLQLLNLRENKFSGPLPSTIYGMTSLEYCDLALNDLNGSLSIDIGNMTSLRRIGLEDNNLIGMSYSTTFLHFSIISPSNIECLYFITRYNFCLLYGESLVEFMD